MPDLQPLPADEPFIQFNISTATDRKRQVVSFPIPQNYLSLGCMLNQVHVPHSTSQRPTKRFYITSSHAPRQLQLPSREYLSFLCTTRVTRISYSTRWSERARDRHELWCGSKVSVVRCHRRRKNLTTSMSRTIRCTIFLTGVRISQYFVRYAKQVISLNIPSPQKLLHIKFIGLNTTYVICQVTDWAMIWKKVCLHTRWY